MKNIINFTNEETKTDYIACCYAKKCLELILIEAKIESLAFEVLLQKNYKKLNKLIKLNKKHNVLSFEFFLQNEYLKTIA